MIENGGIQMFGQHTVSEILKEYKKKQTKVMGALDTDALAPDHKRKYLWKINIIKDKSCGKIKDITFTDRIPQ